MNFNKVSFLFIFFVAAGFLSAQSKFFIKYKSDVSKVTIEQKLNTHQVIPQSQNALYKPIAYTAGYFAKGLGKDDEILSKVIKITFQTDVDLETVKNMLSADSDIEFVEPSHIYHIDSVPNDSLIAQQWALQKIHAFEAWDLNQGADTVLLGIIDTGIDYLHPDLKNKIYINPGETGLDANGKDKRFNGIDDDGDGFVDDYMGYDFVDRQGFPFDSLGGDYLTWDNNPMDEQGHGTYIAGIAAAQTNNHTGIAGVAPNLKILNLRAMDPNGNGEEDDVAAAILYAVKMGVKVINMSFGDTQFSYILRDVIRYAYSRNVVLVGSSGNDGNDEPHYPSGYAEVICVGNSTSDDYVAGNSNYGSTIDLVAPGTSILTTDMNNSYSEVSGTSAATPFVTAAAGLILSQHAFSNEEVRQILKSTADDIESGGWDVKSGAGRLNLYKALSVLAPAKVKIDYPARDFATYSDTLNIAATVISPYFVKYELMLGYGITPDKWQLLTSDVYQKSTQTLYTLDLKNLPDTVYTIRLLLYQSNGNTQEERVDFYIMHSKPQITLLNTNSIYYGEKSTLFAELTTDQRCITRMFYRKYGETSFNFVTLDGFTTNNQFVKNYHYGFVPKQLINPNTVYEIYFEAENLAGLKTVLTDSLGNYFLRKTDAAFSLVQANEMPFSLPKGTLYQDPVSFLSNSSNEVLFNQFYNTTDTSQKSFLSYCLYKLENNAFTKVTTDSLLNKIPRAIGDFNNNGKLDILSSYERYGYIDEVKQAGAFSLNNIYKDETKAFFPIMASDINGDNTPDIITLKNDTTVNVWNYVNGTLTLKSTMYNFSDKDASSLYSNILMKNFVVADANNDGVKELWFVDRDGDIMSYNILGNGTYQKGSVIHTDFATNYNNIISVGDYDGDGVTDIAVLFNTSQTYNIAPYQVVLIFNTKGNTLNILYENFFLDQSSEFSSTSFNRTVYNSLRFSDIDNDKKDELVISVFPYSYILKRDNSDDKIIYYREGVNSYSVFSGDLNKNGVNEIGLSTTDGIKFYEFLSVTQAVTPSLVEGYSISDKAVYLKWSGESSLYYIYKGASADAMKLIDSCSVPYYTDANVVLNSDYYYQIKAYDKTKQSPYSALSTAVSVHTHTPARLVKAESLSTNTVLVTLSDRVNNTIENLRSFEVLGSGYPSSISAASQYSYLLTYNSNFPTGSLKLTVSKLRDYYGSPVAQDTLSFVNNITPALQEFIVSAYQILDKFQIKVDFNLPVDSTSANVLSNYAFEPSNNISRVALSNDGKSVYLFLDGKKPVGAIGREYKLKINNLLSSKETGNIKINSQTGSYLILTGNAKDISDVYVYPNPVKTSNGKITFANLPRKAKILIMTLSGQQLATIYETDGDGGVDYNLRTPKGDILSTGIYLFRVTMLDDADNEIETKIGKFAVIR